MRYLKTVLLVSSVALFTACGGGGGSDSTPPVDYSGDYHLVATATTAIDNYGNPCVGVEGMVNVTNLIVTGRVVTSDGDALDVNGEVTSTGQVSGGFTIADTDENVASYEGHMEPITGTWSDINGCSGTWIGAKKIETRVL